MRLLEVHHHHMYIPMYTSSSPKLSYYGSKYEIQQSGDGIYWEKLQSQQDFLLTQVMITKMDRSNLRQVSYFTVLRIIMTSLLA